MCVSPDNVQMGLSARLTMWMCVGLVAGCSPTFNWREARPADGVVALLPCRPQSFVREVMLAGERVQMKLLSCAAGGSVFAVSRIDVGDPSRSGPLLHAMRSALATNLAPLAARGAPDGVEPALGQASTAGRLGGQLVDIRGTGPDGEPMRARGEFFSHRGAVYQATVVGRAPDPQAVDFFFSSLKLH